MEKTEPLVYIVVVTFNGKHHLERLLPSISETDYPNYQLLIVDNHSSDDTIQFLDREYRQYSLIRASENLGFAGGNNLAIEVALKEGADYVFLLNNDTVVIDPRWLREAVIFAESNPNAGFVGLEERLSLDSARGPRTSSAARVQWVSGSSMLVKSRLFREVGLLDEEYFMYGEEDDLQARAAKAGYTIWRINAPIYHAGMGTAKSSPGLFAYYQMRNSIRYAIKNKGLFGNIARVFRVFDAAVNPIPILFDKSNQEHCRIRHTGKMLPNLIVFLRAITWNLIHLSDTLKTRNRDARKIRSAREGTA